MKFTPKAKAALEELIEDYDGDYFAVVEDNYGEGICTNCGELRSECEPDAENYPCESCGENKVVGLESAILSVCP